MAYAPTVSQMTIGPECALWVVDAIDSLRSHTDVAGVIASPTFTHKNVVKQMTLELSAGRVGACLDILARNQAPTENRHDTLQRILVLAIYDLETAWKQHTLELGALIQAFGTARHVLDVWRNTSGHLLPQGLGRGVPVLVAVAPQDQHIFGARIVADDLSMRGFDVTLCAEATSDELIATVAKQSFAAVTLSFGYDAALEGAADLIARLRVQSRAPGVAILAGGPGLSAPLAQYSFLGADAVLRSAHEAAGYIGKLTGTTNSRKRN